MEAIKEQLRLKYPFLRKTGTLHTAFDEKEALTKYRSEKLLVIMVGVQGAGKTTFCKEHFSEYPVVNLDDILLHYLETSGKVFSAEGNKKINEIFFDQIEKNLRKKSIVVMDAGAVHVHFRVLALGMLQGKFTKAIIIALNPSKGRIIRQVKGQIQLRARPGLWQDIDSEYELMQNQIQNHVLEMGVDEVYLL